MIIYVDIDGTICTQKYHPDWDDRPVDYAIVEPFPERIKHINELYEKGHTIVYWSARGCRSGLDHTELTIMMFRWETNLISICIFVISLIIQSHFFIIRREVFHR